MISLKEFIDKWKHKYPSMVKGLSSNDNLFTFYAIQNVSDRRSTLQI